MPRKKKVEKENEKIVQEKPETESKDEALKEETEEILNKEEEEKTKSIVTKEENAIDEEKLEKIEKEIKKQTTISEKKQGRIYFRIFKNIVAASIIVAYFMFVNLGYINLEPKKYLIDLQVFSIITIGITIVIFERAYKKDSDELALFGIESLALSICTLMTIYIGSNYKEKYTYIINTISMIFGIYYVAKSIVIYCKMRNKALKRVSDIRKIGRIKE